MKILVTGSSGFIAGYLIEQLLEAGHKVSGVDDFSKYGPVQKSYDQHPKFRLTKGDARDGELLRRAGEGCDIIVAAAAKIGGISYFHRYAYDLLANNERILAATFDAAIDLHKAGSLKRIVVISSSMVFE